MSLISSGISSWSADLSSVSMAMSFAVWVFIAVIVLVAVVAWVVSPVLQGSDDNVAKHKECVRYGGYYFQFIPAHDSSGRKKAHRSGLMVGSGFFVEVPFVVLFPELFGLCFIGEGPDPL